MAIEAIKGQKALNELSMQYNLLPKQISDWKTEFLSKASLVFTKEQPDLSKDKEIHELHARIGELDYASFCHYRRVQPSHYGLGLVIKISMDERGLATDDIYIERFWRSIKYEDLYVKVYENGESLYDDINSYMLFYNGKRLHESLDYKTPDKIYHKVL